MSDVRSTHFRDARANRRHGTVSKLQCCGHRSERFYLASIIPAFAAASGANTDGRYTASTEEAKRGSSLDAALPFKRSASYFASP